MATIGVGILGTGRISGVHVEALQGIDGAEVVAACSTTRERVESFASRYRIPHAFTDSSQLLVQPGLDAVVIATPNDTHAPLSIAALEAGKHVLCEKPMALNFAQARKMAAVSENTGRLLMIGMCRRFGEKVLALRRFVEQGDLGHVYYARAGYTRRWGNPGGWFSVSERSGGGPVIDLGVHVIDLVRYLLGGPRAVSVSASVFGGVVLPEDVRGVRKYASVDYNSYSNVEDGAVALIRFDTDLVLVLEVSWNQHKKRDSTYLELYGDRGGAQLEPSLELYLPEG